MRSIERSPMLMLRSEAQRKEHSVYQPHPVINGIALGESPRWHDGRLWFCDWGAQEIITAEIDGSDRVAAPAPPMPFTIDWLPDGRLLIVSGREGRVLRREADGSLVTHAELTALSQKPWNDVVVDHKGNAYVGNMGFVFPGEEPAPGTLALVTPDGSCRQVADGMAFPNGAVITPDQSTLIVAESYGSRLTAFDIEADGGLSGRHVWAETPGDHPDGICIDSQAAVWYADVGNKRCVRVREGGEVLDTVEIDRGCFACALGGPNNRTLFLVGNEYPPPDGARTGRVFAVDLDCQEA
jgi:sugar lactone lactonase YvrE